jgi:hypothetical protein
MKDKPTENTHYYVEFVAEPPARDDGVGMYNPVFVVKRSTVDSGNGVPVLAPLYRPLGRVDGQFAICFTLAGQDAPSGDEEAFLWFGNFFDVAELVRLCRDAQTCAHEVADRVYAADGFDPLTDIGGALSDLYEHGLVEQMRDTDGRILPRDAKAVWKVSEKGKCLSEEDERWRDGTSRSQVGR